MAAPRFAAIDVGTNTVLLLVAERRDGAFVPLVERAEITRLGRGVDRTGRLDPAAIQGTVEVLARFAAEARALGAEPLCVATSAARDAANGAEFFEAARRAAGLAPEVIPGDEEARLVWSSAWSDFGGPGARLCVVDVGGGSTELCDGDGPAPRARHSVQIGAVRLTERVAPPDPPGPAALDALRAGAAAALAPAAAALAPAAAALGAVGAGGAARMVGVAGTVTTLAATARGIPFHDAQAMHGTELTRAALEALYARLGGLTTAARARLPGMEPKRADVILGGCAVLLETMRLLGFDRLTVSDRGVRWGLLQQRFGEEAGT